MLPTFLRKWTLAGYALMLTAGSAPAQHPAVAPSTLTSPDGAPPSTPVALEREEAVRFALENNPQIAAIRQQHHISAAGVVLARVYPYNPITQSTLLSVNPPSDFPVTNRLVQQHKVTLDVEVLGQKRFRKSAAAANLARTDWEIAFQETTLAIGVIRFFDTLLYRQEKLRVIEDFLRLNEESSRQIVQLVERGSVRAPDLLVARSEVDDLRAQIGQGRAAVVAAKRDFYRSLGALDWTREANGKLDRPLNLNDVVVLQDAATEFRADLHARRAAVSESEARVGLAVANRLGNPNLGPVFEYDQDRIRFVGVQFGVPLPVFNRGQGEIALRKAERGRSAFDLRQAEVEIRQEVLAAVERVKTSRAWVDEYRNNVIPRLQKRLTEIEGLLEQGQPGADALRVVDIRRKLLKTRDGALDAEREYADALADLAYAVGDPALALGLYAVDYSRGPACDVQQTSPKRK